MYAIVYISADVHHVACRLDPCVDLCYLHLGLQSIDLLSANFNTLWILHSVPTEQSTAFPADFCQRRPFRRPAPSASLALYNINAIEVEINLFESACLIFRGQLTFLLTSIFISKNNDKITQDMTLGCTGLIMLRLFFSSESARLTSSYILQTKISSEKYKSLNF